MRMHVLTLMLAGLVPAPSYGEELPPIPDKPEAAQFKGAPEGLRDYLIRARAAERIGDPLQRCLAYPDPPGSAWPSGHAEAHCRLHAAHRYSVEEVARYLERGAVAELEGRLDAALARHFSEMDFGEDIDTALEPFEDSSEEAGRVTALWLERAPKSPYAHVARGNHLWQSAASARGSKWAAETPRENFRRMTEFVDQAIPMFEAAIALEPRLMTAYKGLLGVARIDSRAELEQRAAALAREQDPACAEIARARMTSLEPRWGGSYEEMLAYAAELAPHVARRPLLAMYLASPYGDRVTVLIGNEDLGRSTLEVAAVAARMGSLEAYSHDMANILLNSKDESVEDDWKALVYLLQEARFSQRDAWTYRNIGRLLMRAEPELALAHLARAEALEPDDAYTQYAMGASFYNAGRFEQADRHYRAALPHQDYRQASLRELVDMWMFDAGLERKAGALRAAQYLEQLLAEYPDDGRAWLYRFAHDGAVHGRISDEVVQSFMRHADRSDPRQDRLARLIEEEEKRRGISRPR